jgi:hypothetical protein
VERPAWLGGDAIADSGIGGFMSSFKIIVPAVIMLGGFLICTTASYGNKDAATATKKGCIYCHAKVSADKDAMNKNLTDAGKYYKEKKSLDGYVEKKK